MMTPLQSALTVLDAAATEDNWIASAMASGLMTGYDSRWRKANQSMEVLECEKTYVAPLTNLTTGKDSRTYRLAGKIDKLVADDNAVVLYDHKTTSQDISNPDSPYWRQLIVEGQPLHYELLLLANAVRLDRVVWDVIRKPGIRPKKLAKADRAAVVSLGTYTGLPVSQATRDYLVNIEVENAELYAMRVGYECISDPDRYFQRRSVPHLQEELIEYAEELWDLGQEVRLCRNTGRNYRNSGACMLYGSPCKFLGLCSGHDTVDSDKWQKRENVFPELGEASGELDILTNSRLRCFQTCRRKHFYEYELAIERVEEEEKEALAFGSLMHAALDAWWCGFKERVCDDCSESAASEAAVSSSSDQELAG